MDARTLEGSQGRHRAHRSRAWLLCASLAWIAWIASAQAQTTQPAEAERGQAVGDGSSGADPGAGATEATEKVPLPEKMGEELLIFEDMPVVVSAARQPQPVHWLSVPVSTITAEDIHYSGLTTIPEILRFTPGVDVLRVDRNRYAVGIRGLHDVHSERVQTLIDGRLADSPLFGGAEWFRLPVLLEDVKRIEVVRGPAGAAWGANAFTGVINIITKDPEDCLGWFAATTWNHVGDSHNHVRWAAKADKWSWRMSVGYAHQKSSEDAVADDHFISRDFSRDWRFDAKAIYRSSDWTKWSFGGAYSQIEAGDYEFQTLWRGKDSYFRTARSFLKVDHSFRGGATGYLQFFNNYEKTHDQSIMQEWTAQENDIEGQLNFKPGQKHKMSIGGNLRWTHINTHSPRVQDFVLVGEPFNEYWGGVFVTDRWEATDRLALEGQLRGDCYSGTHPDWSGRLTGLYALDAKKRHVCRLSTAKAFRAPQTGLRKVSVARMPHPMVPGTFLLNLLPNENLDNEQTWSLEAGYTGRLTQHLTVTANGYFQRFDELISVVDLPDPMAIGRRFKRLTENDESAKAWGGEFELALKGKPGKLSAWYAYNAFQEDTGHQTVRAYQPANHKAGLTGRLFLPGGWALNANYSYSDTTPYDPIGNAGADARAAHRLDLAVAKEFAKGQAEVAVGVTDVLNRTDDAAYDRGAVTAHDTLGRTFFVRLQVKF